MVEEVVRGEFPVAEEGKEGAEQVEEPRQVKHIRPKENPTRRAGTQRETEKPLKWGFRPTPEPPRVADLGGGGEEDPGEDSKGDEGHGEGMEGGDGAERDGPPPRKEETKEEVEEEREEKVERDRGEEK